MKRTVGDLCEFIWELEDKYNLLDYEGNVDQINAKGIGQMISKEITGTIPTVSYSNY